jgi:hypothetical protein
MGDRLGIHGAVDLFKWATKPGGPTLQELKPLKQLHRVLWNMPLYIFIFDKALIT